MAESAISRPCRILVVDDESIVRDVIRNVLEKPGLYLVDAADGEAAIVLLLKEPFDLLIADKNLPGITGLDVIRRAKAVDPTIGTLLITAFASRESAEEAMAIGVDDYLVKPFNIEDLVIKVDEAKQRRADRQKLAAAPKPPPTRCRVMVCEPDQGRQRILVQAVEILGHRPVMANGLSQVLMAVRGKDVDAVICNLELLSRDNATACFLRSTLILSPQLRFAVVTANRHLEGAVQALRHGANKVLYQPLGDPPRVAESLRAFLSGSQESGAKTL